VVCVRNYQPSLLGPLQDILGSLKKVKSTSSNQWKALCPAHVDKIPSLSISEDENKILLKCHAGCTTEQVVTAMGMSMSDLFSSKTKLKNPIPIHTRENSHNSQISLGDIVAEYNYTDPLGKLLYQVVRYNPKTFRQRQRKDSGGYIWNMTNTPRVLYNLPAIARAKKDEWIFAVEGEKDADSLGEIGFTATTNPGGAGKWGKLSDITVLKGRRIAIIPDLDETGWKHSLDIARSLKDLAEEFCILNLSEEDGFSGKDVSDWIKWREFEGETNPANRLTEIVSSSQKYQNDVWAKPCPINSEVITPEFPVDVLPDWLGNMISQVSVSTQTPLDLAGTIALGVLATAGGDKLQIQITPDWFEPINLFLAVAMNSGTRKSSVFSIMTKPLEKWEETAQDKLINQINEGTAERALLAKKISSYEKLILKGGDEKESDLVELRKRYNEMQIPYLPRLIISDVTPEGIVRVLHEQNGRLGIFSSEGAELLSNVSGRYSSNGQINIDTLLKAHSGETITVDRSSRNRNAIVIRNPRLTMVLCMQPSVLDNLWKQKDFKNRGFLARMLCVLPPNPLGSRKINVPCISEQVKTDYLGNVLTLLNLPKEKCKKLKLSDQALKLFNEFRVELEPKLGPDGQYKSMTGWGSKCPGAIARLAGVLHLADKAALPNLEEEFITEETMLSAIKLGEFFIKHIEKVQGIYGESDEHRISMRIINHLKSNRISEFSMRDIYRELGETKKLIEQPLKRLEMKGHIRCAYILPEKNKKTAGRKSSPVWEVNPYLHEDIDNCGNFGGGN